MSEERPPHIQLLPPERQAVADAARNARREGKPIARAAFMAMTREAQGRALRSQGPAPRPIEDPGDE